MINKKFSKCWLKNINKILKKKKYFNIFKNIYIKKNFSFIKNEILFYIKKKINFVNSIKKATLIFIINKKFKNEEYLIKNIKKKIFIFSKNKNGFLYSLYHIFEMIQLKKINKKNIFIHEKPHVKLRIIQHLDNLDGSIEKGYSGNSIFFLKNNINFNFSRIIYYCKLLCSIKINAICINNINVNISSTFLITKNWLIQLYEIYNILYEYNIKMFLSVNYQSPLILSKINTFDPLNKKVINWWETKIEEIYSYLPYLGGFLIETDSKYNKGPISYKRNHIEGCKNIAKNLNYFNGILIWKCNIFKEQNWRDKNNDKILHNYEYFKKFNNMFPKNVILQINSPIGYQVREPVSPLLGSMNKTSQILELQINQEFTGQQIDLCWLPIQWKNIFNFNTYYYKNKKSTIKKLISGKLHNAKYYGVSVISNIGDNYNWTGNYLSQSNIFSYGNILWNLNINLNNLLKNWIKLSISNNNKIIKIIKKIIFNSWKIYEKYTSPLGIGGMVDPIFNYKVNVDGYEYINSGIYHNSNRYNIGYDRTSNGSNFVKQYSKKNFIKFNNPKKCPEELLLFFHNLPYKYKLKKYKYSIIQYIYNTHFEGVKEIYKWIKLWNKTKFYIKKNIFRNVKKRLKKQYINSIEWRDKINTYFYRKSGIKDKFKRKIYK